jgi:hypothetical protein
VVFLSGGSGDGSRPVAATTMIMKDGGHMSTRNLQVTNMTTGQAETAWYLGRASERTTEWSTERSLTR